MTTIPQILNFLFHPGILYLLSLLILALIFWKRKTLLPTRWFLFGGSFLLLLFLLSLLNSHFYFLFSQPDNVAIILMLGLVLFFTFFSLQRAVQNDQRIQEQQPVLEKQQNRRTMTWPNLVYLELICMVCVSLLLLWWALIIQAPLEDPANPTLTPNPTKAPWYFVGLQELLVYFDPWLAGAVFPALMVLGLMAIPYLDPNPKGNGYYSFEERKWAISIFLVSFLSHWILLIVIGTFLRGPGWNFFGLYEAWDPYKVVPLSNTSFSEWVWVQGFGLSLPQSVFVREIPGVIVLLIYGIGLPWLLQKTLWKKWIPNLSRFRFYVLCFLLLMFLGLPIKMMLRWIFGLKYIVSFPEFFLNL